MFTFYPKSPIVSHTNPITIDSLCICSYKRTLILTKAAITPQHEGERAFRLWNRSVHFMLNDHLSAAINAKPQKCSRCFFVSHSENRSGVAKVNDRCVLSFSIFFSPKTKDYVREAKTTHTHRRKIIIIRYHHRSYFVPLGRPRSGRPSQVWAAGKM